MLYVKITRGSDRKITSATAVEWPLPSDADRTEYESRNGWHTLAEAEEVATALNAGLDAPRYIATDAGAFTSPRYDVIELPRVGDAVSYYFNGDSYPCGIITKISTGPGYRRIVATETFSNGKQANHVFYRVRNTACWKKNRTWSLIRGHHSQRNPEF